MVIPSTVRLNEFLPFPSHNDWNGDGVVNFGDAWIEIVSLDAATLDLGGWILDDTADSGSSPYVFPAGTLLPPHGFLLCFRSATNVVLNQDTDTVRLVAPDGATVDSYSYRHTAPDRSYSRTVNGSGAWTETYPTSPGSSNLPAVLPTATSADIPTATWTPSVTLTPTGTLTVTLTPVMTTTGTPTATLALTITVTVSGTLTPTITPTASVTATLTVTPTGTATPLGVIRAYAPQATVPAPAPGPTNVPGPNDPHVTYTGATDECSACHRIHTAVGSAIRSSWPEENLCFGCHAAGGPGTNVQPAFSGNGNTGTSFFKHDVAASNGAHHAGENGGGVFGSGNRHVECEDCHSPHKATRGSASAPVAQRVMNGASGVDPQWAGAGAAVSYNWLPQAEREYQVCLKCHSGFTSQPSYVPDGWNGSAFVADGLRKLTSTSAAQIRDSRDMAQEFNPANGSFHPVMALGRNQAIPAGSFVSGWSQGSIVYCADCHGNAVSGSQGLGPHGSPLLHILVGAANNGGQVNYTTVTRASNPAAPSSQELCFKCHAAGTYLSGTNSGATTNFRKGTTENLHRKHSSEGTTCYSCHDTHGSEQEHLINFEIGPQLSVPAGRNSQTAWFVTGTQHGCALTCHGKQHNGDSSTEYRYP